MKKKREKQGIIDKKTSLIVVLSTLLVLAAGYILIGVYSDIKQKEELKIFQQGAQFGYEQAIMQLIQQAVTCEPVQVRVQNQTINMIAVECLEQNQ